jgi:MFS family permease
MMSIGWPLASFITGRMLVRTGAAPLARAGGVMVFAGSLIVALVAGYGPVAAGAGSLVLGAGLGILNTTFIVTIQSSVGWNQRGIATAMTILMRILGNALGAAVFGGVLNVALQRYLAAGLGAGLHIVFWVGVLFAAAALAASWRLPHARALDAVSAERVPGVAPERAQR